MKMKAILHTKFGSPDELQLKEIEKPVPKDNEVLIKIHATSVTSTDCNIRNLTFVMDIYRPFARLFVFGVFKPRKNILGIDLAGVIEAIGKDVKRFKIGDKIFGTPGFALGCHAEYRCMPETGVITLMPKNMSWEEAAAIPLAANTALFYLKTLGNIRAGQKVLIIGASGAIGTYAVQLAKSFGTEVTGVCSTKNLKMVKSLGSDYVIDYTKEDFSKNKKTYDLIFDTTHNPSFSRCKNSFKPNGIFLPVNTGFKLIIQSIWNTMTGGIKMKVNSAKESVEDLEFLKKLFETGKLKPVIDRSYSLEQITEAFKYVEKGHKKGNVVITVRHDN